MKLCPHCGAKMVEYKHSLSSALAEGLRRLKQKGGGPINLKTLGLTRNQWDNFQKLRYWGLVVKAVRDDGKHIGGAWVITIDGMRFLNGHLRVAKCVWTYRGEAVRFEGDPVSFQEIIGPYKTRPEYAREAIPHHDLFSEG